MPRTVQDQKIQTRTQRLRLAARGNPYYRHLTDRVAIGYRRLKDRAGVWVVRERLADGTYKARALPGVADDILGANGGGILSFDQAVAAATTSDGAAIQDLPVADAMDQWADDKCKAIDSPKRIRDYTSSAARIGKAFSTVTVRTITAHQIKAWRDSYLDDTEGEDARRKRRATANRNLATLKAALNKATREHKILMDHKPWDAVEKFPKADAFGKRLIVLTEEEQAQLIAAAPATLGVFIELVFETGCRPGELQGATVGDVSRDKKAIQVDGKTGSRKVVLSPRAREIIGQLIDGANDKTRPLLVVDGKRWEDQPRIRAFRAAAKDAGLDPSTTLYAGRHTYITRKLTQGVPPTALAQQCGTSVAMIEQSYAHFLQGDFAEWFGG